MSHVLKVVYLSCLSLVFVSFQNCQRAGFKSEADVLSLEGFSGDATFASTKMNTPVEFNLRTSGRSKSIKTKFSPVDGSGFKGRFEIVDAEALRIRYTPEFGFRGSDRALVDVSDAYGTKISLLAVIRVGNPLATFEPAMAVRGIGCIQCHANVASNIISDFGFGNDYYFGQKPSSGFAWNSGAIYGDHAKSLPSMSTAADKLFIVPKAAVPAAVTTDTGAKSLIEYVRERLGESTVTSTRQTTVEEKSHVYIGAPTDADLKAAFALSSVERSKYFANDDGSPSVSGLKDFGDHFVVSGNLSCDGDLLIKGPLLIDNISLETINGCRIYVIGSVFLYGPNGFSNTEKERNLQITSTKSISLGLGLTKKRRRFL